MNITQSYSEAVAGMLRTTADDARDALYRVVNILDPSVQSPGCDMPYPPNEGWRTALEQQIMLAQTANDTIAVILGRLREAVSGIPVPGF